MKLNHGNNYVYHAATPEQASTYALIRQRARDLAELIDDVCPDGRERAAAHGNLEQAMFWANASIARG